MFQGWAFGFLLAGPPKSARLGTHLLKRDTPCSLFFFLWSVRLVRFPLFLPCFLRVIPLLPLGTDCLPFGNTTWMVILKTSLGRSLMERHSIFDTVLTDPRIHFYTAGRIARDFSSRPAVRFPSPVLRPSRAFFFFFSAALLRISDGWIPPPFFRITGACSWVFVNVC